MLASTSTLRLGASRCSLRSACASTTGSPSLSTACRTFPVVRATTAFASPSSSSSSAAVTAAPGLLSSRIAAAASPSVRAFSTSRLCRSEAETEKKEMTSGEEEILQMLTKRFKPTHVQVQDVSGGCGSFYAIIVASKEFQGLNTVKQHRLVNECLKDIIGGIHGLQLKTIPAE